MLPAHNEARAIAQTLGSIRRFLDVQAYSYEVVVSVDGDDGTAGIVGGLMADWPELKLTAVPGRRGKGYGLRAGVALTSGEIVGFLDADYKTPVEEVPKALDALTEGYDLVIGSRAVEESAVQVRQPRYRQVGSRVFATVMHTLVGLNDINDTQCGFKFFTNAAARAIFSMTRINGYMTDIEILWLAKKLGLRIKEVGIRWADDGDSRLRLVKDTVKNGSDLFRIRFGRQPAASKPGVISANSPVLPLENR